MLRRPINCPHERSAIRPAGPTADVPVVQASVVAEYCSMATKLVGFWEGAVAAADW